MIITFDYENLNFVIGCACAKCLGNKEEERFTLMQKYHLSVDSDKKRITQTHLLHFSISRRKEKCVHITAGMVTQFSNSSFSRVFCIAATR